MGCWEYSPLAACEESEGTCYYYTMANTDCGDGFCQYRQTTNTCPAATQY